jgi:glucose/arabinose dehydrogenase
MDFSPDGRLFVTEKGGNLRVIKNGALLATPFLSVSVNSSGERGLLGIAFDPNFATNGHLYVYYTTSDTPIHNRVSRFTADPSNPDRMLAGSEFQILNLETLSSATNHNGGAIHFGKDGKLYVAVGENANSSNSQSLSTRLGKMLRINSDGTIPSDNPFYNTVGAKQEIWALGLRNPFTFAFSPNPSSTLMYINDVGRDTWEEINSGIRGANYGWPTCEGVCSNSNFVNPIYSYAHNGAGKAIAGGAFYESTQFPSEYKGSYFFGDYVADYIKRLTPTNQVVDFLPSVNSPVDIKVGPDGSLYYLSIGGDSVHKVQYVTSGNSNPVAVATASPTSGQAPLSVNFDGTSSSDPDAGTVLVYSWNFGDGSSAATGAIVTHVYDTAGPYVATLTVNDNNGGTNSATVNITVGNPPVGTIDTPVVGTKYSGGDTISFSGSGNDQQDGVLQASAFNWVILFHHNTHTHPFLQFNGVKSGSFAIPTLGETSSDAWYRIYLTVTDSTGLKHLSTRDVLPNKSTVTLTSSVPDLQVNLDGQPQTTPYSFVGVVGMTRTLQAPSPQNLGGQIYQFQSWSDGGSATHTINTPSGNPVYTENYVVTQGGSYPIIHMQDTTATGGYSTFSGRPIHAEYVSSTSQLVGDQIDTITLRLSRVGSPTGFAQIGVFNTDLSVKKLFDTKDVSTISTSYTDYTFALGPTDLYTIQSGDRIGIKYTGGDSANIIKTMTDGDVADPFDGTNTYRVYYTTTWISSYTTQDLYMILTQTHDGTIDNTPPVISSVTFTPTAGTSNVGDTIKMIINSDGTGYTAGAITVNGKSTTGFASAGGNNYQVFYTIASGDNNIADAAQIPVSVVLTDAAGNSNTAFTTSPAAVDSPAIDASQSTTFPIYHMQDTTATGGYSTFSGRPIHAEYVTPSSQLVGDQIDTITLRLSRVGSPTGFAQIGVFNTDLSVKKLFDTKDVSTISTSYTDYTFALGPTDLYTIQSGDRIGIKYTGGDSANIVKTLRDGDVADPFDGTNTYRVYYTTSWVSTFTSEDLYMVLTQTH